MRPALLAPLLVAAAACERAPERPNVLLITVDTWRADRLSAAGGARGLTPNLDRLAAEGLVFTRVTSPRAKTTPAVASLMSGMYPHEHGARDLLIPVPAQHALLAERLRDAGWDTAAVVGNYVLKDDFAGLRRGFASWTEDLPDTQGVPPEDVPQRAARSLTDGALAALGISPRSADGAGPAQPAAREGRPWFLWLHYMDPHGAYNPPAEYRAPRAAPEWIPPEPRAAGAAHQRWIAEYNVPAEARGADGRIDARAVRDLYDGEVRYADAQIGRLIDALRARGELERTLVVITSDHGESLGEQDYWFEHGRNVSEATLHVPLVVRWPASLAGGPAPGTRQAQVSLCDVAPTVLDLLGLPPLADGTGAGPRGASRLGAWRADDAADWPVFAEKVDRDEREGAVQSKAVRLGDWKRIRRFARAKDTGGLAVVSDELYDLAADPLEAHNLAAAPPARAPLERLEEELARFASADGRFPELGAVLQEHRRRLERSDPEALRILRALGY
jgi:arylsulfatase A-like enzyme